MQATWDAYYDRLGPQGLRLVISCLLDDQTSRALAGPDGGRLDGESLVDAVAALAAESEEAATELLARLDEASEALEPRPESWEERRLRDALAEMLGSPDAESATVLHRLARVTSPLLSAEELRAAAEIIAAEVLDEDQRTRPKWVAKVATDETGLRELEQERRELEGRMRQLESQLARAEERISQLEERLARNVDELRAQRRDNRALRDERQRLEREGARLKKRIDDLVERRARERTGEITTALRKLTTEQRRGGSLLEKLGSRESERSEILREHGRRIAELSRLVERVADLEEAQARTSAAAQQEILRELSGIHTGLSTNEIDSKGAKARNGKADELPRVGLFVDVQNMFYGAREKGARLDFEALLNAVTADRRLVRAVAYLVETREIDQSSFIHLLQMKAYEVKRKPLRVRPDRSAKGNWDLEMALDALATADHVDVVVLATGDGDFVPLVQQLKLRGLRVEVYGFTTSSAPDLREAADRFVNITKRLLRPIRGARKTKKGSARSPRSS